MPERVPSGKRNTSLRYNFEGNILEKRLLMPYRQNTIHITYSLLSSVLFN